MISVTELFYNSFSTARESEMEADDTHTLGLSGKRNSLKRQIELFFFYWFNRIFLNSLCWEGTIFQTNTDIACT